MTNLFIVRARRMAENRPQVPLKYCGTFFFIFVGFFLSETETGISFANKFSLSWTEGLSPNTKRYGKLFTKGVNLF